MKVVIHGVSLSLGGAELPDRDRLDHLVRLAKSFDAPFVSEHIAFVRAGGLESGHLLPVPRTRDVLEVLVENVNFAQSRLPVPLALENIATLLEWPCDELDEAAFIAEFLEKTNTLLLLDLSNLYANVVNYGWDLSCYLDRLPLDRLAYVHVAGGVRDRGFYHDTHAHAIPGAVLDLLENLCERIAPPGVLLERDDHFPGKAELFMELDTIAGAMARGRKREVVGVA